MNIATNNEMTWFVQRLIDIRNDVNRTPNHIADIKFDYREIISQKIIFGKMDKFLAQRKVCDMLALIKNDYTFLNSLNHFDEGRLVYEILSTDGNILIKGYQMEVLDGYLAKIKGVKKKNVDQDSDLYSSTIVFKKGDEFYINEGNQPRLLKLKKTSLYYKVFNAVYELCPDGGTISYADFAGAASLDIKNKFRGQDSNKKCSIVKSYLTDKSNGFLRASKIGESKYKGKSLFECDPAQGIVFNNKR